MELIDIQNKLHYFNFVYANHALMFFDQSSEHQSLKEEEQLYDSNSITKLLVKKNFISFFIITLIWPAALYIVSSGTIPSVNPTLVICPTLFMQPLEQPFLPKVTIQIYPK